MRFSDGSVKLLVILIIIMNTDGLSQVFGQVDTALFRAFAAAAEAGSFTLGARRAAMTQSGMSQQIARLESQIGLPLFERINKRVLLTPAGRELQAFIGAYAESLDVFIDGLRRESSTPRGPVRYAMPASCLKTPHFPLLLEKRAAFPEIQLKVELAPNERIYALLLESAIDFGFVTQRSDNPAFRYEPFAEEEYVLVGAQRMKPDAEALAELPFVDYPGMRVLFQIWREQMFPRARALTPSSLRLGGEINDLDGAITMLLHGLGVSVVPRHCVEEHLAARQLHVLAIEGRRPPTGRIYIASRGQAFQPARVRRVIEAFREMKSPAKS